MEVMPCLPFQVQMVQGLLQVAAAAGWQQHKRWQQQLKPGALWMHLLGTAWS